MVYGALDGTRTTYAAPDDAVADDDWTTTKFYPEESTLFTCKNTYIAAFASTLATSTCKTITTQLGFTAGNAATLPAGSAIVNATVVAGNAAGGLASLKNIGVKCNNLGYNLQAANVKTWIQCGRCTTTTETIWKGGADVSNAAQVPTCLSVTGVANYDTSCVWWYGATAVADATGAVCKECADGSALTGDAASMTSSCKTDAVKLANCYKAKAGTSPGCAICKYNSWMNGSGVCIAATPTATTKAATIIVSGAALLAGLMMLN